MLLRYFFQYRKYSFNVNWIKYFSCERERFTSPVSIIYSLNCAGQKGPSRSRCFAAGRRWEVERLSPVRQFIAALSSRLIIAALFPHPAPWLVSWRSRDTWVLASDWSPWLMISTKSVTNELTSSSHKSPDCWWCQHSTSTILVFSVSNTDKKVRK